MTDDPLHDLEQIGVAYRRWALENATTYGIMFNRAVPDFAPSAEAKEVSISTFFVVVDAVRRAQAKGHFADAEPEDIAQVVWAVAHGSVSLEIAGMTGPYPERMPPAGGDRVQGHRGRARRHRRQTRGMTREARSA